MPHDAIANPTPILCIGHPGHEVRVHGWLTATRPMVCVLTDGSGHHGTSRLASTTRLLDGAGATPGPIYGRLTDRALYQALRTGDTALWETLALELADLIVRQDATLVVGDAAEGFNPGHDVCRFVIDAAVALTARRGHHVENLEFPLDAAPDADAAMGGRGLQLDDEALERKIAAAHGYAELRSEVDAALERFGRAAFRHEWLRPASTQRLVAACDAAPPWYERHGLARVTQGLYDEPVTWHAHVRPAWQHLVRLVPEMTGCASS